ncbi:MAG: STAS domain-containing protein [Candidatus Thorarchaeota archaeon]|jgi:anti-anti-sigma factor
MAHVIHEENGVVVLELAGKIMGTFEDTSLIDEVCELVEKGKMSIVLDFSKVDWMNSRGLGICITVLTTLRNRDGDLKLACPSDKVESFLDRCKMFAVFETYKTVEEAVASFE